MRDKSRRAPEQGQAIDLTPMLDVVFIMLIFFIVTATFIKTPGQEVDKSIAKTDRIIATSVLVAITESNEIFIDKKKIEESEVKLAIQRLYLENPKGGLVIIADAASNLEKVALVADAAKELNIPKIAVSTRKE